MELYRKKVNLNSQRSRPQERYDNMRYNPSKRPRNIYLQKMAKQNPNQSREGYEISSATDNIPNVRSNMEDIFADDSNKNRAIKYVIQIGKSRNLKSQDPDEVQKRFEKSASPRGRGAFPRESTHDSNEATPLRKVLNLSREPYYSTAGNRFRTINNESQGPINNLRRRNKNKRNLNRTNYRSQYIDGEDDDDYYDNPQNYLNPEESQNDQNDYELSSFNDDDRIQIFKNSRSPEPRIASKFYRGIRKPKYSREIRNKDIQAMPKYRKNSNNKYISNNLNNTTAAPNNVNTNTDEDADVDELIRTIEDLQSIINGQKHELRTMKKDNFSKDKEIVLLKNELDNMQKELDDKRVEHDKEIEDIFRSNDNNPKLKSEYFKLLQDYDNNINDYNILKDDYNKMVDEYNNLKNEKKRLAEDNKNLKQNNTELKQDYLNMKNEANKALDEYNNIVDDYNKLDKDHKRCKNNMDQLKFENDRLKKIMKEPDLEQEENRIKIKKMKNLIN